MGMKTKRPPARYGGATGTVAVYIEPLPGVSEAKLKAALKAANVTGVSKMTPGIMSAQMPAANIGDLEAVAGVEVMHRKSMR
jgi:hypothetical protein